MKLRPQDLPARVEELSGTEFPLLCDVHTTTVAMYAESRVTRLRLLHMLHTKLSTIYLTVKSLGYTRKVENATSKVLVSLRNLRTQPRGWDGQHRRDQIAKR